MAEDLKKRSERNYRWDTQNTKFYGVKLMAKSDADCIEWLEKQPNKVDAIRQAIRAQIEKENTKMMVKDANGNEIYYEVAVNFMDDEIREEIHAEMAGDCTEQEFYDEYCKRHEAKFGEEFKIN